jgi:DNA polymerase delta subunit 1
MKKADLIEECKKRGLDCEGKSADLKERIKFARVEREESVEDLFKKYEHEQSK